jgi:hypothetical protein
LISGNFKMAFVLGMSGVLSLVSVGCELDSHGTSQQVPTETQRRQTPARQLDRPALMLLRVPVGTNLTAKLVRTIGTGGADHHRHPFTAELMNSVIVEGTVVFPKATRVRGHARTERQSDRGPVSLSLTLDSIQTLEGRWINIDTTDVSETAPSEPEISGLWPRKLQFAVREAIVLSR